MVIDRISTLRDGGSLRIETKGYKGGKTFYVNKSIKARGTHRYGRVYHDLGMSLIVQPNEIEKLKAALFDYWSKEIPRIARQTQEAYALIEESKQIKTYNYE